VPGDQTVYIFYAKAAFVVCNNLALVLCNLWVDENTKCSVTFVFEIVAYDNNAPEFIYLHGSEGDANLVFAAVFPLERGGLHVGDKLVYFVANKTDFFASLPKVWAGEGNKGLTHAP
jgi:hypothetical protein